MLATSGRLDSAMPSIDRLQAISGASPVVLSRFGAAASRSVSLLLARKLFSQLRADLNRRRVAGRQAPANCCPMLAARKKRRDALGAAAPDLAKGVMARARPAAGEPVTAPLADGARRVSEGEVRITYGPGRNPNRGFTMATAAKKATARGANPADAVSHLAEVTTVCTACSWIVPTR